jgi:hypothetical protein
MVRRSNRNCAPNVIGIIKTQSVRNFTKQYVSSITGARTAVRLKIENIKIRIDVVLLDAEIAYWYAS